MWFSWHLVLLLEIIRQGRTGVIVARLGPCLQSTTLRFGTSLHMFYLGGRFLCFPAGYRFVFPKLQSLGLARFFQFLNQLLQKTSQAKIFSHTAAVTKKSQPDLYQLLLSSWRYHTWRLTLDQRFQRDERVTTAGRRKSTTWCHQWYPHKFLLKKYKSMTVCMI